jgi:hypothetical protein
MKSLIKKSAVLSCMVAGAALSASSLALAAGDSGHGGEAMVCRDPKGAITGAWSLDLWEGENIKLKALGFKTLEIPRRDDLRPEQQAAEVIKRVALVDQKYADHLHQVLLQIEESYQVYEFEVDKVEDAHHFVHPKGCKPEQLADYTESYGIVVQKKLWEKLSPTDQAALLVHEAIYKTLREPPVSATTSDDARPIVAKLFSTSPVSAQDFGALLKRPLAPLGQEHRVCKQVRFSLIPLDGHSSVGVSGALDDWDEQSHSTTILIDKVAFGTGKATTVQVCGSNQHTYALDFHINWPVNGGDPTRIPFSVQVVDAETGTDLIDADNSDVHVNDGRNDGRYGFIERFYLDR